MLQLAKSKIGLKIFIIFTAILCACVFFVISISALFSRDFGKQVIAENEEYIKDHALSHLVDITEHRAQRYEAVFQRLSTYSRLIARQAELRFRLNDSSRQNKTESASSMSVYPGNGIYYTPLSTPAMICYWGGTSIPDEVADEINLLAPMAPILAEAKNKNPEVVASHMILTSGVGHYFPNGENVYLLPPVSELDLRNTNNYVLANPHNNPEHNTIWVPVYFDDTGNGLITTTSTPIYSGAGEFLGTAGLDIPLSTIHKEILERPTGSSPRESNMLSLLLDQNGNFIYFPIDQLEAFGIASDLENFTNSFDLLDRGLQDSSLAEIQSLATRLISDGRKTIRFTLQEEAYLAASKVIPSNGWRLVNIIPEKTILTPIRSIEKVLLGNIDIWKKQFSLIAILFLIGSLAIMVIFLKRFLTLPLQQITTAAKRVSEGRLGNHLDIDRVDEIGSLANSFNIMVESLRQSKELEQNHALELESKVACQTEELQHQKLMLEQALEVLEADVQRRKQIEKELIKSRKAAETSNQAKSDFLANMTHELRTPLIGVLGMNELLLRTPLTDQQKDLASTVQRSGETLLALISDILDFSKIESGHLTFDNVTVDITKIVEDTTLFLTETATEKKLSLFCEIAPESHWKIEADPLRLRQILFNLISNAVKFTTQGEIFVRLKMPSHQGNIGTFIIEVEDTGIGMKAADQDKIFAPFAQIDSTTTRAFGGTGLGLSIVRQLIGALGGKLRIESELGKGSLFQVELEFPLLSSLAHNPNQKHKNTTAGAHEDSPGPLWDLNKRNFNQSSSRILVADDYPVTRELVQHFLNSTDLIIDEATSGKEVLDQVKNTTYDLILMDCNMPEMDGMTATRRLREQGYTQPIIAMTAHVDSRIYDECQAAGMNDHLRKPFRYNDLEVILKRWLFADAEKLSHNFLSAPDQT